MNKQIKKNLNKFNQEIKDKKDVNMIIDSETIQECLANLD